MVRLCIQEHWERKTITENIKILAYYHESFKQSKTIALSNQSNAISSPIAKTAKN